MAARLVGCDSRKVVAGHPRPLVRGQLRLIMRQPTQMAIPLMMEFSKTVGRCNETCWAAFAKQHILKE
jgi:hypothetical protein